MGDTSATTSNNNGVSDPATNGNHVDEDIKKKNPLDEKWYYYQNPTTGSVSSTPLTLRQLCKLFCPVREGMTPILPAHTRCLEVTATSQQQSSDDWKLASDVEVLKEASAQWYVTTPTPAGDGSYSATKGPMSCRGLLEEEEAQQGQHKKDEALIIRVYAEKVTPEWTLLSKLDNLQFVFQALKAQKQTPNEATATAPTMTNETSKADPQEPKDESHSQEVQDELEAFLSSTAQETDKDDGADEHTYESDGGTKYVKDPLTGNWIHEALAPQPPPSSKQPPPVKASSKQQQQLSTSTNNKKKEPKKPKFSKRNAKHWIYVTGLPKSGVTVEDLAKYFGKAGLLDLDPETLQPKIKLYKNNSDGTLKGDASICYARPESVELSLQILDESPWDEQHILHVERATFQAKNNDGDSQHGTSKRKRAPISEAKRKVARLALRQAQDEGFGERLAGGRKGLRIIVVKHMLEGIPENKYEEDIHGHCSKFGGVEKITVIEKTKIVLIKFVEPTAASEAIQAWHGQVLNPAASKTKMHAIYWDGVTDYTHKEEDNPEEEEQRHEEFGKWLEGQEELPPELRLRVEPG